MSEIRAVNVPNPAPGADPPIIVTFNAQIEALVYSDPDGGYSAEVPALPGCITEGSTLEEVQANLIEAAEGWLAAKAAKVARERPS